MQTGRPKKANDNGHPTKKLTAIRRSAGTVREFSVVHATVGLAQARPNYSNVCHNLIIKDMP